MSDPRTILERTARRIDPRSDAFERLERRRARKARNRRITAGVVALLVAIGGSYAAFTVFRDSGGTIGGQDSGGFHALWPEQALSDAQQVQERVDARDPDVAWRLDAASVAGSFVNQAFGWDGYSVQAVAGSDPTGPGPVEMLVQSPDPWCYAYRGPAPCPTAADEPLSAVVVLERPVNPGGIWSVVEVYDSTVSLRLPISPGATVVSGQEIVVPFRVPAGFEAEVGYGYVSTDCGGGVFTNFASADVRADGIRFTVADMSFEQSCEPGQSASAGGGMDSNGGDLNVELDGYIFVALQHAGVEQDDPFDANLPNVIANAPVAVAGVPVHFVPVSQAPSGGIEPLPTVAQVTCSDAGTQVAASVVQPQPDGVHIVVDNSTGEILGLQIKDFGGDNAPTGSSEIVRPIPPGVYGLACTDAQSSAPPTYQPFEVQDPAGIWVSTDLGCSSASGVAAAGASSSGTSGVQGTPVDVVINTIPGLQPTDLVEAAGYTSATDEASVRVVRGGEVVAVYHMFSDGQGGWTIDSAQACGDTDLASLGSATYPPGAFQWCPDLADAPEPGRDWADQASAVALRFVDAYVANDAATLAQLTDPSVPSDAVWPILLSPGATPSVTGTNARGGDLVNFGCGNDVDAYTVAITIDDGTNSASLDFTLYLILRADGWKVWGSY